MGNKKKETTISADLKEKIHLYCEEDVKAVGRICHKLSDSIIPLEF